jgi:flagellar protein FliJ
LFRFRLEALFRIRLSERDQRRSDLAKALRAEQVLRTELERLQGERLAAASRGRALKEPGAADMDALLAAHRYEVLLAAQGRQLAGQLAQVEAECDRRRLALVEADRDVRVLEMLRERRRAEYQRQRDLAAVKELDEVGILTFIQRQETSA